MELAIVDVDGATSLVCDLLEELHHVLPLGQSEVRGEGVHQRSNVIERSFVNPNTLAIQFDDVMHDVNDVRADWSGHV